MPEVNHQPVKPDSDFLHVPFRVQCGGIRRGYGSIAPEPTPRNLGFVGVTDPWETGMVAPGVGDFEASGVVVPAGGVWVSDGGTAVAVGGTLVVVGGTSVAVGGTLVAVGGTSVAVGGAGVVVGGTGAHRLALPALLSCKTPST